MNCLLIFRQPRARSDVEQNRNTVLDSFQRTSFTKLRVAARLELSQ
jgi:hypothetical protein